MTTHLISTAQAMQPYVVDIRRTLHRIPELRWQEERTLAFIRQQIEQIIRQTDKAIHPDIRLHIARGGLWVDVTYNETWSRCLLRADVDALPIQEQTGLPFASQTDGLMHACGHDTHAAMLLGAFKAMLTSDRHPTRNLRFVFQRAEENPLTESGGAVLVEEGVLAGVSEAHALHIWSTSEAGLFLSRPGPAMANSDRLKIVIRCQGGHVAHPEQGVNAIDIGTDIQCALRGLDTRLLGPHEPVSLVPAIFQAGQASNTLPAEAELWFAVRNVLPPARRTAFHQALTQTIETIAARYADASVEVTPIYGHPALVNSPACYEAVKAQLESAEQRCAEIPLSMGGEDFAHYLEEQGGVPGSIWFLGAWQAGTGGHHTPTFNPDEAVFWRGVLFWLLLSYRVTQGDSHDNETHTHHFD